MCAELLAFPAPSIPVPGRIARNPHMRACGIYGPCMTPLINPEDKVIVDGRREGGTSRPLFMSGLLRSGDKSSLFELLVLQYQPQGCCRNPFTASNGG